MNKLRKNILLLPGFLFWSLFVVLFSDAADLDNFIPNADVTHGEVECAVKSSNCTQSALGLMLHSDHAISHSNSQTVKSLSIFDQDSPSITPEVIKAENGIYVRANIPDLSLTSFTCSSELYLRNHSFLI